MFLQCKIWIRVLGILMFVLANSWSMMGEEYTLLSPDRKLKVQFIRTDEGSFEYKFLMEIKYREMTGLSRIIVKDHLNQCGNRYGVKEVWFRMFLMN